MENKPTLITLKSKQDFARLKDQGKASKVNSWLLFAQIKNDQGFNRYGWTIPRYVGNAVTRNRLKRWFREKVRTYEPNKNQGYDVNFVFLKKTKQNFKTINKADFDQAVEQGLSKLI